jgi:hypothetical protein
LKGFGDSCSESRVDITHLFVVFLLIVRVVIGLFSIFARSGVIAHLLVNIFDVLVIDLGRLCDGALKLLTCQCNSLTKLDYHSLRSGARYWIW